MMQELTRGDKRSKRLKTSNRNTTLLAQCYKKIGTFE